MIFAMMFDDGHTGEGLTCIKSIEGRSPNSTVYVLCLEPDVETAVAGKEHVVAIKLVDLETQYPLIAAKKADRDWASYVIGLKPFLMEYILDTYEVPILTFVDSDIMFWGACEAIETELGENSILVTPYYKDTTLPVSKVNAGCFSCRDDVNARAFLTWWKDKCIDWCKWENNEDGKRFGEEGYLSVFLDEPERFSGVRINTHLGINLGLWQAYKHRVNLKFNGWWIDDGAQLICYHYHGFVRTSVEYIPPPWVPLHLEPLYRAYHAVLPLRLQIVMPGN